MTEQTKAPWPYPLTYDSTKRVSFDTAALAYVRDLVVWWDGTEHGAAGVEPPMNAPIKDAALIVDMFLNTAHLDVDNGTIRNPYADGADLHRLDGLPDAKIEAAFRSGAAIPFEVNAQDRALWAMANRTDDGIDCKRPFGSENVLRDIRRVIDPEGTLARTDIATARKTAEARMALFLQFFVQAAKLPMGQYVRGKDYVWRPDDGGKTDIEEIDWMEWALRVIAEVDRQSQDYTRTGRAVAHLVWEGRIKGDYATLNKLLSLHNLYEGFSETRYIGHSREMAEAGLRTFNETGHPFEERAISINLVRVLNGTGDFAAAQDVMQAAGMWDLDATECSVWPLNPQAVAYLEQAIAQYGLGEIGDDTFTHRAHGAIRGGSSFVYDILHGAGYWENGRPKDLSFSRYQRAQAIAAQISIMRGPCQL